MPATNSGAHEGGGGDLAEPLLPSREEPRANDDDVAASEADATASSDDEDEANRRTRPVAASALLTIGGLVASAVAVMSAAPGSIAVYVAGAVCALNSAGVAAKERVLVKQGGLRKIVNKLEDQASSLRGEVDELKEDVDSLRKEVDTMEKAEEALDIIAREQGSNCDEIISLLRENEEIVKKQKSYLRQVAIADITEIVLKSDRDGSMTIDPKEANELTHRVQLQLSSHGIKLDPDRFKAMITKDNDITHVLKIVGAIMFGETIKGKRLSEYAKEALREEEERAGACRDALTSSLALSGAAGRFRRIALSERELDAGAAAGREASGASLAPSDATGRSREIGESAEGEEGESEDEEETSPMFSMNEEFHGGSVSTACGERASLSKSTTCEKRSKRRTLLNKCKRIKRRLH